MAVKIQIARNQIWMCVALSLVICCGCEKSNPTAILETDKGKIVIELYMSK